FRTGAGRGTYEPSENLREEVAHRLPCAPVGIGLEAEGLVLVERQVVRGERMTGVAEGEDLPVDAACRQLIGERDGGVGRAKRIVPAVENQQLCLYLGIGEGRRIIHAVEAHAALDVAAATGKVEHAFAAQAKTDCPASGRIDARNLLEFGKRIQKAVA